MKKTFDYLQVKKECKIFTKQGRLLAKVNSEVLINHPITSFKSSTLCLVDLFRLFNLL